MKKLILGLVFGVASLFALPDGRYFCIATTIMYPDGLEYKIPLKKAKNLTVSFELKDDVIVDGAGKKFKYIATKDKVDFYGSDEADYIVGLNEKLNDKNMVGMIIAQKKQSIISVCKYLGK